MNLEFYQENMKVIIFTTKSDLGSSLFVKENSSKNIETFIYYYEDMTYKNGQIKVMNEVDFDVNPNDHIILRDPYNDFIDYSFFLRLIVMRYYKQILIDRDCYLNFPMYEDKLYQSYLFERVGVSTPSTSYMSDEVVGLNNFPCIIKLRVSSRAKGVYIINSREEFENFFMKNKMEDHIIQEYIEIEEDYRVIVFGDEILGIVERSPKFLGENKISKVKVIKSLSIDILPEKIKQECLIIVKELEADLVGLDVVKSKNEEYYFIEANLSPQFNSFQRESGVNVVKRILDKI